VGIRTTVPRCDIVEPWQCAADVVADWFLLGLPPRDAIAQRPELRTMPASERAEVVRLAHTSLAMQRYLGFVVAGVEGLVPLAPHDRATVLVLTALVVRGELPAAAAGSLSTTRMHRAFDFTSSLERDHRLSAIEDAQLRFAIRHSLPDWLAAVFLREFGAEAEPIMAALNGPAPRTIRTNTLRVGSRDALVAALAAVGIVTHATQYAPLGLQIEGVADLFATSLYREGAFEQQDEASQLAVVATAPPPRGRVLDLCAGNGGKALGLSAVMGNRGEILATDVHEGRLQALRVRARRAGVSNLRSVTIGEDRWPADVEAFAAAADRILIDAPCSGIGSWRRRPEARWLLAEADLASLNRTQDRLLDRTAALLRPGARIVYATCSLLPQENEQRVDALLARRKDLERVRLSEVLGGAVAAPIADANGASLSLRPNQHGCDGFFAAILRKRR
jgi:16S rRNA (cytosine967-C5)-methyltransferase